MCRGAAIIFGFVVAMVLSGDMVSGQSAEETRKQLRRLAEYEAPIFVWDRIVLNPGGTVSGVLKQTPIKLPDGHVEKNKAIIVRRGNWASGRFVNARAGTWFMITLLVDGRPKGVASGLLLPNGYGTAIWCRDGVSGTEFNCFFRTSLQKDGGVRVRWTMLHSD